MVNDGNNRVAEAATLKIRCRSEVKHRHDRRVETACPVVSGGSVGAHGFAAGACWTRCFTRCRAVAGRPPRAPSPGLAASRPAETRYGGREGAANTGGAEPGR